MRVRSALRVGDELQGSWWGVPRTFTVLGGMFLRCCGGGENSSRRYDQWRLVNEVDTELWVEIDRNTSKVFFCETVSLAGNIDPRQVGVGQVFLVEVEGSKCSAAVVEVGEAMIEDVIGTPGNTLGAGARTSWAELEVKDAVGNVSGWSLMNTAVDLSKPFVKWSSLRLNRNRCLEERCIGSGGGLRRV